MSRFAAFAAGVVLISSADWALVAPTQPALPPICAASEDACQAAIPTSRWDGRYDRRNPVVNPVSPSYTACQPQPYCRERRDQREDCIAGFDCRSVVR